MADETRVINGSFKGLPIVIDSSSVNGGRKNAIHQYPGRDTQTVEDLGLKPRQYSLDIVITRKLNETYFDYRDKLLAALEGKGVGVLIHPFYGRIESVKAISFSLNESFTSFGDTTVSVSFEIDNNLGIPQASSNVITQLQSANDALVAVVQNDIASNFSVSKNNPSNFTDATEKVTSMIDRANSATAFIGEAAQDLNAYSAEIGQLSADVNSLVTSPLNLASSIVGMFETVGGLYASSRATLNTFLGFFRFGLDDLPIKQDTAIRIERQSNRDVLNSAMNAQALGYAYLYAANSSYETTSDIDLITETLSDQFIRVMESNASQEVKDSLDEIRLVAIDAFASTRQGTPNIITIATNTTSVRLLAFNQYGNDTQGETIAELNELSDVSFVEGNIRVITDEA